MSQQDTITPKPKVKRPHGCRLTEKLDTQSMCIHTHVAHTARARARPGMGIQMDRANAATYFVGVPECGAGDELDKYGGGRRDARGPRCKLLGGLRMCCG